METTLSLPSEGGRLSITQAKAAVVPASRSSRPTTRTDWILSTRTSFH